VGSEMCIRDRLRTAFSRWPIERCFKFAKNEIGMDHFEVRSWCAIHRHLYISQLSQLFCCRVHQDLREKKAGHLVSDGRTGSLCSIDMGSRSEFSTIGSITGLQRRQRNNSVLPVPQSAGEKIPYKAKVSETASLGHRSRKTTLLYSG